ncbi:hypothetical protein DSM106972_088820 [Dulcicalothrix desertica PCC 7102]|uniref:Uncharacterized protein n=1 Tax=Dulcicalothrix desertica PCC 7102 TaxID=232991 RepID=A0A433UPW6_9CYAN|nr:hypothetical protein [Dulcicalothrix desertica]RUS95869.1 hypothetical protein DSM106972_088820 [Dulcicalothrix desertica PCC 7102]TWH39505.1 hypothetical protein CAL7102_08746 [Dulcicalothrix desertica PCC 7102]
MISLTNNNESWSSLIEAVLEKVRNGISQGTWHYKYGLETNDEISQSYYYGEAINGSYSVNFGFDLCAFSLYYYYIIVKNDEEVLINIAANPPSNVDSLKALLNEYWIALKDSCEQAKALLALDIVNQLPN